jgi:cytochrome c
MRKNTFVTVGVLTLALTLLPAQAAEDHVTKEQAKAMVEKAVALIRANGTEGAYPMFDDKTNNDFHDRDLYIVVYDLEGKCLAHGANAKLVGKDLSDAQDVDGVYYVKDRVKLATSQASFWQDYKFANPVTKKIEAKQTYCERLKDTAVCGGIYK